MTSITRRTARGARPLAGAGPIWQRSPDPDAKPDPHPLFGRARPAAGDRRQRSARIGKDDACERARRSARLRDRGPRHRHRTAHRGCATAVRRCQRRARFPCRPAAARGAVRDAARPRTGQSRARPRGRPGGPVHQRAAQHGRVGGGHLTTRRRPGRGEAALLYLDVPADLLHERLSLRAARGPCEATRRSGFAGDRAPGSRRGRAGRGRVGRRAAACGARRAREVRRVGPARFNRHRLGPRHADRQPEFHDRPDNPTGHHGPGSGPPHPDCGDEPRRQGRQRRPRRPSPRPAAILFGFLPAFRLTSWPRSPRSRGTICGIPVSGLSARPP